MKKNLFRAFALLLSVLMLLPVLAASPIAAEEGSETPIEVYSWKELFYEDHVGDTVESLTAGNDTTHTNGKKTPINNLYDLSVVGTGYTPFSGFGPVSKNLYLQGNHAAETTSKNLFLLDNDENRVAGKGMITVIPEASMQGLEEFTISWITRCHDPKGGYMGLALFYDKMETVDGVDYFGGYDNYTYAGFTGSRANAAWSAHSIYDGKRVDFQTQSITTAIPKNTSIYSMVHCTKGAYTVDGVTYTAKIESYVDDQHVSTSYAQWADAPVMFYYENPSSRWSVQFTNLKLTGKVAESTTVEELLANLNPISILGTSVRHIGESGLRFFVSLEKDSLYENATVVETGVLLLEKSLYQGELTVSTPGVIKPENAIVKEDGEGERVEIFEYTGDALLKDKSFYAAAFVKYTISGKEFYAYSPIEKAGCARTAAKVVGKYADSEQKTLVDNCKTIAGNMAPITMMSFNVLVPGTSTEKAVEMYGGVDLTYSIRNEASLQMIMDQQPDIIGTQEMSTLLQKDLWMTNTDLTAIYDIYGSDDDPLGSGGSGEEGQYILYKKDRFEFVSGGTKYLSDDPDKIHSLFPEAEQYNKENPDKAHFYPRKLVWVVLRDKLTGQQIAFANTHLAYTPSDTELDALVRAKQAALCVELLTGGTLFDKSIPFAIVGDMNAKPNTEAYNCFTAILDDARYTADTTAAGTQGTHHSYKGSNTFIDHIFISRDSFYNHAFQIVTKSYKSETLGKEILPSDHYAIISELTVLPE